MPLSRPVRHHAEAGLRALRSFGAALVVALPCCAAETPRAARALLVPCRIDGYSGTARCGRVTVPENREQPQGKQLSLRVAVIPAASATPEPDPLTLLVGGPGQAATQVGGAVAEALHRVLATRDVVLVDQRGTGESGPLTCPDEHLPFERRFDPPTGAAPIVACLAGQTADTSLYATPMAVDDLEAVRQALGYPRWNLWGGSYGTRVALAYLQRHPAVVRRAVLDGAAPTDMTMPLTFAADAQAAFDALAERCVEQSECLGRVGDPRLVLQALLTDLDRGPVPVRVRHPSTGEWVTVPVSRLGLASGVRGVLYSADLASVLPLALHQALGGDFGPLLTVIGVLTDGLGDHPAHSGMALSVLCAEDLDRLAPGAVAAAAADTFLGDGLVTDLLAACAVWRHASLPAEYFAPVQSPVPTLVLSGQLDPVTPPRWGELVASRLPESRHVVVPGVAHGTTTEGCVPDLIADFLQGQSLGSLDADCVDVLKPPPLFVQVTGPGAWQGAP